MRLQSAALTHQEQNKAVFTMHTPCSAFHSVCTGPVMYHTGPPLKLGTRIMQSDSPEQGNVQVCLAFSTLSCQSKANHAIAQEDVLLTQLCSTIWSKQLSDALLIFRKKDQS